jgi:hypothetical protein
MRVRGAALAVSAATAVSAVVTCANRFGDLPVSRLAASPESIGEGRVWLVLSSALLADRPAVPSLIGFWIVGFAALLVLSARVVAGAAVAGHTLSALGVYGVVGAARLLDPNAFASVVHLSDYGLSAIIAAWLGSIGRVLWARHPAARARLAIAVGALGCAGIGLAFRPDLTFLDSEHVVAFAIGAAVADVRVWQSFARPARRLVAVTASALSALRG